MNFDVLFHSYELNLNDQELPRGLENALLGHQSLCVDSTTSASEPEVACLKQEEVIEKSTFQFQAVKTAQREVERDEAILPDCNETSKSRVSSFEFSKKKPLLSLEDAKNFHSSMGVRNSIRTGRYKNRRMSTLLLQQRFFKRYNSDARLLNKVQRTKRYWFGLSEVVPSSFKLVSGDGDELSEFIDFSMKEILPDEPLEVKQNSFQKKSAWS